MNSDKTKISLIQKLLQSFTLKNIEKAIDFLLEYKWIAFIFIVYFYFEKFLVHIYNKYIVTTVLEKFESSLISNIIISILSLIIVIWSGIKLKKKFYIKLSTIIYLTIFIILYTYIRFKFNKQIRSIPHFNSIKYTDILYLYFFSLLFIKIGFHTNINYLKEILKIKIFRTAQQTIQEEKLFIYNDNPEENIEFDILDRKEKALQVAEFIKSGDNNYSMAIGIVAKWGEGKTTFMKFIQTFFKDDEKYIIIDFKGWLNVSVSSILNDFFETVQNELKPHSFDIAKEIKKYSNSVLSIYKTSTTETISNVLNLIPDTNTSVSLGFKNTNDLMLKLNKKVIVFFDDLDRLQPEEVFEVLKLIRNTASFTTFNYVVGYDKEYVIKALEKQDIPNPEKYCEKIFINEVYLLPITNSQVLAFVYSCLKEYLDDFAIVTDSFGSLGNLREAKRFLNEFSLSYNRIKGEVDIKDFLLIKLIKFSYYDVYKLLYTDKNSFLTPYKKFDRVNREILNLKRDTNFSTTVFKDSDLYSYLKNNKLYVDDKLIDIGIILNYLFVESPKEESLCIERNYMKYFMDALDDSEISKSEFSILITSEWGVIVNIISKWETEGRIVSILPHLYKVTVLSLNNRKEYENYIKLIFILSTPETPYHMEVDYYYIANLIEDFDESISSKFYNNRSEMKNFIIEILNQAKFPYSFEMKLCQYLYQRIRTTELDFLLSKDDIENYLINKFKNFTKKDIYVSDDFFKLYNNTELTIRKKNDSGEIYKENFTLDKIKILTKELIIKWQDEFLWDMVEPEDFRNKEKSRRYRVNSFILKIFSSYDDFIRFVKEKLKRTTFQKEFLDFAEKSVQEDNYLEYEFTNMPSDTVRE